MTTPYGSTNLIYLMQILKPTESESKYLALNPHTQISTNIVMKNNTVIKMTNNMTSSLCISLKQKTFYNVVEKMCLYIFVNFSHSWVLKIFSSVSRKKILHKITVHKAERHHNICNA